MDLSDKEIKALLSEEQRKALEAGEDVEMEELEPLSELDMDRAMLLESLREDIADGSLLYGFYRDHDGTKGYGAEAFARYVRDWYGADIGEAMEAWSMLSEVERVAVRNYNREKENEQG
jgi:hypothetical protein